MPRTNTKEKNKLLTFSSSEAFRLIDETTKKEASLRGISQSLVIEEYILAGIGRNYPEYRNRVNAELDRRFAFMDATRRVSNGASDEEV